MYDDHVWSLIIMQVVYNLQTQGVLKKTVKYYVKKIFQLGDKVVFLGNPNIIIFLKKNPAIISVLG